MSSVGERPGLAPPAGDETAHLGGDYAFVDLYETNFGSIYRAALAFSADPEVALDATQEAFARAYSRWDRLAGREWVEGWVMTTALNLCRRRMRRERVPIPPIPAETGFERVDLLRALRRLPPRRRLAAVLFYIGDHPIRIVAELMDLSEGAVKAHLSLARKELRKGIGEHDG